MKSIVTTRHSHACKFLFSTAVKRILPNNSVLRHVSTGLSYNVLETPSDEPPILMAHGVLGNKNNFNFIAKKLSKETGRTIITYDARNHGKSPHYDDMTLANMSNDAIDLLDSLHISNCVFIGHSMGGRVAMYTALAQPNRIDKLVVVDSSPVLSSSVHVGGSTLHYIKAMRDVSWEKAESLSVVRKNLDVQLQRSVPEKSIRQFMLTNADEPEPGVFKWRVNVDAIYRHVEQPRNIEMADGMRPYTRETLFVGGGSSQFIGYDSYPYIKTLFPTSIISHIPDSGHWVHSEKPTEFVLSVAGFLQRRTFNLFDTV